MIIEIKEKWPEILETIKSEHEISDVSFKTWLQPLIPYDTHDNVLFLLLPDERMGQNYINYIDKKYTVPLKVAVAECTGLARYTIYFSKPDLRYRQACKLILQRD